mmetsp:Transcript_13870/g.16116  ORF Transcript_13870/g.16116 Transcript_13870/m.16116 type:complete len:99 (+) Transcript_13870:288-584(+)
MPVTQRLKAGAYRLQLWIDIADHIYFDNKQHRPQGASRAVMYNWLFNDGNTTEQNDATQEDATRNDHNQIDDTQWRAIINAITEDNSLEDNLRRREER